MLSRNITVPRPGIRVGFIPGGSTDSVSFQWVISMSIQGHDGGRDDDCHVLLWILGGDVPPWKPWPCHRRSSHSPWRQHAGERLWIKSKRIHKFWLEHPDGRWMRSAFTQIPHLPPPPPPQTAPHLIPPSPHLTQHPPFPPPLPPPPPPSWRGLPWQWCLMDISGISWSILKGEKTIISWIDVVLASLSACAGWGDKDMIFLAFEHSSHTNPTKAA